MKRFSMGMLGTAVAALLLAGCGSGNDAATPGSDSGTRTAGATSDTFETSSAEASVADSSSAESPAQPTSSGSGSSSAAASSSEPTTSSAPTTSAAPTTTTPTSAKPTTATPTTSARNPATTSKAPAPAAKPVAPGTLPARIGGWYLLTDADLAATAKNGRVLAEPLAQIGYDPKKSAAPTTQLGDFQAQVNAKGVPDLSIKIAMTRTFGVRDKAAYEADTADTFLMTTSAKITGPDAAKFISLKKADFEKDSTKEGGKLVKSGRVWCEGLPDGSVRGCIVFGSSSYLETEIIPRSSVTPELKADLIAGLDAVGPH